MTVLHRTTAASRVPDLARQLAEDFHHVPLSTVSEAVTRATEGIDLGSRDPDGVLALVERRARHDLESLRHAC